MSSSEPVLLTVVIPALNEENGIHTVLERLVQAGARVTAEVPRVREVEVLVVDDGSTDRTAEIAGSVPGVRVLQLPRNRGYGGALKAGFEAARGQWLAFLDADGTYPPEFLPVLARAMAETGADVLLGSRMSGARSGMPLVRRIGNLFFAGLLSWITGRTITDTASGMRMFRRDLLPEFSGLPDGLNFTPAMSALALHCHLDIREIPMPYDERVGHSKLNPVTDGLRFLATILRTAHRYNPLKVFGLLGLVALGIAFAYGIGPLYYYLQVRRVEDWEIYRLISVIVLSLSGVNLIFFGLSANIILSAAHRAMPFRNSLLARLFLRRPVLRRLWAFGVLLMVSAAALNHEGLYTYITRGEVLLHWSYILTGSLLFMLGLTFALWGSLVRVIVDIHPIEESAPPRPDSP